MAYSNSVGMHAETLQGRSAPRLVPGGWFCSSVCARAQIYTHRADVDDINARQLARCGGERIVFAAQDVGSSEALAACLVQTWPCTLETLYFLMKSIMKSTCTSDIMVSDMHASGDAKLAASLRHSTKARADEAQEKALHAPSGGKARVDWSGNGQCTFGLSWQCGLSQSER